MLGMIPTSVECVISNKQAGVCPSGKNILGIGTVGR